MANSYILSCANWLRTRSMNGKPHNYYDTVVKTARRFGLKYDDVEDYAQDFCLKMLSRDSIDPYSIPKNVQIQNHSACILRSAKIMLSTFLWHAKLQNSHEISLENSSTPVSDLASNHYYPDCWLERKESWYEVLVALEEFTDRERHFLIEHFNGVKPEKEIARNYMITVHSVEQMLYRASQPFCAYQWWMYRCWSRSMPRLWSG